MIYIDEYSPTPLYQQIYEQFKGAIKSGDLVFGEKLPATRALASRLCISRNTVESAYQQLLEEGYVQSRVGSGFAVSDLVGEIPPKGAKSPPKSPGEYCGDLKTGAEDPYESRYPPVRYDFQFKNLSHGFFPHKLWRKYTSQLLSDFEGRDLTPYHDQQGERGLRLEISKYLYRLRGIECDVDQIVIRGGLEFALETVGDLLPPEYRHVGMEEPGYDSARLVFEKRRFKITPIRIYPRYDYLDDLECFAPQILFLTPAHQFPTGRIMTAAMRGQVLEWADRTGGYIIEDDYGSEYRYNSKPIPALQSFGHDERVIYLGSFFKPLSPGLRLNFLVLPKPLVPLYHQAHPWLNPAAAWLQQATLALFMRDGQLEKHLRKTLRQCKMRHDRLIEALGEHLGDRAEVIGANAGLHLMLRVPGAKSQEELVGQARRQGVRIYPTTPYWMDPGACPPDTVLLGYAQLDADDIDNAVLGLKNAWFRDHSPKSAQL